MSVEELELAIARLPREEFSRLAIWFAEYQADLWDWEIESDLRAGRIDLVLQRARDDIAAGRSKPL